MVAVAVKVIGVPEHIVVVVAVIATDGVTEVTVTTPVAVLLHDPKLYVTVYVVVEAGDTVILEVVCPPGDHE